MEHHLGKVIDEDSGTSLHHAFRLTSCSRREHDVYRMVGGQLFELDFKSTFLG